MVAWSKIAYSQCVGALLALAVCGCNGEETAPPPTGAPAAEEVEQLEGDGGVDVELPSGLEDLSQPPANPPAEGKGD